MSVTLPVTAGLVVGFAFIVLFSMMVSRGLEIPQADQISASMNNTGGYHNSLRPTSVTGSIALVGETDIQKNGVYSDDCFFAIEPGDLDGKIPPSISEKIRMAETLNGYDTSIGVPSGGWFAEDSATDVEEIVHLVNEFDFKQEMSENGTKYRHNLVFESLWYDCDFEYNDRIYAFSLILSRPVNITGNHGIVPVYVTPQSIAETCKEGQAMAPLSAEGMCSSDSKHAEKTVYNPFNNTIVWVNQLDSWITVNVKYANVKDGMQNDDPVTADNDKKSDSKKIPPRGLLDLPLNPDWHYDDRDKDRSSDRIYSYEIAEYPWIAGTIWVSDNYFDEGACISEGEAQSLYLQSDFGVKFPSYLPEGFSPACYRVGNESWLIQIYSNRTASDNRRIIEDPSSRFMNEVKEDGILVLDAQKYSGEKWKSTAYDRFLNMIANSVIPEDSQFSIIDGNPVIVYTKGANSIVEVYATEEEVYRIEGKLPTSELLEVAKNLAN